MIEEVCVLYRAVERGRVKCGQYWPPEEDGEEQHEDFLIINTRMEVYQDYSVTWLFLLNSKVTKPTLSQPNLPVLQNDYLSV